MVRKILLFCAVGLMLAVPSTLFAQPSCLGDSPHGCIRMESSVTPWQYNFGPANAFAITSSPTIAADESIYIGTKTYAMWAMSSEGTQKWSYGTGGGGSSAAIGADGTIYVAGDNLLYAINPDGSRRWVFTGVGTSSSPAIGSDGTIYIGSYDKNLYAINFDGALKWKYPTGGMIYSSPVIGTDGTIYVGSDDYKLYAINTDSTLKWNYLTGSYIDASIAIGADGTIYFGSYDKNIYALNTNGTLKWKYLTGGAVLSSPAIGADGVIYVGSNDKNLYAINADGTLKWKYLTGSQVTSSPALSSDGAVYVGSSDGNLYAINLDGTLKSKLVIGAAIESSPTLGNDGFLFVGADNGTLFSISVGGSLANSPWPMYRHDAVHNGNAAGPSKVSGDLTISPFLYAFGSTAVGRSSSPQTFTVTNTTGSSIAISSINKGGVYFADFRIQNDNCSGKTIAPSGTCTISVSFSPTYADPEPGSVSIAYGANKYVSAWLTGNGSNAPGYVLTVTNTHDATGSGRITSSPTGIDCGQTCTNGYASGTVVTLTANADSGSTFTGWSGGGCSGTGTCTVTINSDTTTTASFHGNSVADNSCTYTISPSSKSFKSNGGSLSIAVSATGQSNCVAPVVSVGDSWISQSGATSWKKNKGTVKFVVQKNSSSQNRTSQILIGGNTLSIEEDGAICQLTSIKPSSQRMSNADGSGSFAITVSPQDCVWNASSSTAWVFMDTLQGTGNGTAVFHIDANSTGKNRTGKINVSLDQNASKKKMFTITQNR